MEDLLQRCIRGVWRFRWWLVAVFGLPIVCFFFFLWWISPEYHPDRITFSDMKIDGIPVESKLPDLEAGREYVWSCEAQSNEAPFLSVDSGERPYTDRLPFTSDPGPERPNDRFDPVFYVAFSTRFRTGRPLGMMYGIRVKTNKNPETATLSSTFRAPSSPGIYEFGIVSGANPDGWVAQGPNKWVQRRPKMYPILLKRPLTVKRQKI